MPHQEDGILGKNTYDQRWPAGFITVRGTKIPAYVNGTESATWFCEVAGQEIHAGDKEALREAAMLVTKKAAAKVAVPFTAIEYPSDGWNGHKDGRVVPGEVTGIHGSNGNLLVHWPRSGTRKQMDPPRGYQNETYFRPLSEEEAAEIMRLHEVRKQAQNDFTEYIADKTIKLKEATQAAIDAAAAEMAD
jgi:hypothetical protein